MRGDAGKVLSPTIQQSPGTLTGQDPARRKPNNQGRQPSRQDGGQAQGCHFSHLPAGIRFLTRIR